MANEQNLIPVRTEKEAREKGRRGGIASGKARKQQKTMQEMAKYVLECPLNEQGIARMKRAGCKIDEKNPTMMTAMIVGQIHSAINGNMKSAEFIRDLVDLKKDEDTNAQAFIDALNNKSSEGIEDGIIEE